MSVNTTAAPLRTNNSASAVPWPPAAPVISATLFASFGISTSNRFRLLSGGLPRRYCLHAAHAGVLDCLLDQTRGLCLFNELADIGEPRSLTLGYDHRCESGMKGLVQHARPGQPARE